MGKAGPWEDNFRLPTLFRGRHQLGMQCHLCPSLAGASRPWNAFVLQNLSKKLRLSLRRCFCLLRVKIDAVSPRLRSAYPGGSTEQRKRGTNWLAHVKMKRSTARRGAFAILVATLRRLACQLLSSRFCVSAQAAAACHGRKAEIAFRYRGLKPRLPAGGRDAAEESNRAPGYRLASLRDALALTRDGKRNLAPVQGAGRCFTLIPGVSLPTTAARRCPPPATFWHPFGMWPAAKTPHERIRACECYPGVSLPTTAARRYPLPVTFWRHCGMRWRFQSTPSSLTTRWSGPRRRYTSLAAERRACAAVPVQRQHVR